MAASSIRPTTLLSVRAPLPLPLLLLLLLKMLLLLQGVEGFPFGAPPFACKGMRPNHEGVPQPEETLPVSVTLYPTNTPVWPGDTLHVEIAGKEANFTFEGMLATMQAVVVDNTTSTLLSGFSLTNTSSYKLITCVGRGGGPDTAITHRRRLGTHATSFRWRVPDSARVGDTFKLRLTLVENFFSYWVGVSTTFTVGHPLPPPPPTSPTSDGRPFGTGSASLMTSSGPGNGWLNEPDFRQQVGPSLMDGQRSGPSLMNQQQDGHSRLTGQPTGQSQGNGHAGMGLLNGQGRQPEMNFVSGTRNQPTPGSSRSVSGQGQSLGSESGSWSRSESEAGKMTAWLAGWFGQP